MQPEKQNICLPCDWKSTQRHCASAPVQEPTRQALSHHSHQPAQISCSDRLAAVSTHPVKHASSPLLQQQQRLLQLCSRRSSLVHYWATSASTQCRSTTCCRLETIRLCNTGVEAATLVAHRTPYQVQTVPAHVLSAHQQSATVSDWHRHYSCTIQCTARTSIRWYSRLCQTSYENKVWRA